MKVAYDDNGAVDDASKVPYCLVGTSVDTLMNVEMEEKLKNHLLNEN